jgi:hypothetical protein
MALSLTNILPDVKLCVLLIDVDIIDTNFESFAINEFILEFVIIIEVPVALIYIILFDVKFIVLAFVFDIFAENAVLKYAVDDTRKVLDVIFVVFILDNTQFDIVAKLNTILDPFNVNVDKLLVVIFVLIKFPVVIFCEFTLLKDDDPLIVIFPTVILPDTLRSCPTNNLPDIAPPPNIVKLPPDPIPELDVVSDTLNGASTVNILLNVNLSTDTNGPRPSPINNLFTVRLDLPVPPYGTFIVSAPQLPI